MGRRWQLFEDFSSKRRRGGDASGLFFFKKSFWQFCVFPLFYVSPRLFFQPLLGRSSTIKNYPCNPDYGKVARVSKQQSNEKPVIMVTILGFWGHFSHHNQPPSAVWGTFSIILGHLGAILEQFRLPFGHFWPLLSN